MVDSIFENSKFLNDSELEPEYLMNESIPKNGQLEDQLPIKKSEISGGDIKKLKDNFITRDSFMEFLDTDDFQIPPELDQSLAFENFKVDLNEPVNLLKSKLATDINEKPLKDAVVHVKKR